MESLESRGRHEPSPRETIVEVLQNPREALDGNLDAALIQAESVTKQLLRLGGGTTESGVVLTSKYVEGEELGTKPQATIKIIFPSDNMLQLDGIFEGRGIESGLFGFKGAYGKAKVNDNKEITLGREAQSLERLFGVPSSVNLLIRPTANRWATEKDSFSTLGENTHTLYMGLGLLLLDEGYLLVGNHEAGHIHYKESKNRPDDEENEAWTTGLKYFRYRYRNDPDSGAFGLVKPAQKGPVTIGDIVRYGLSSYAAVGEAKLPKAWNEPGRMEKSIQEFRDILHQATLDYAKLTQDPSVSTYL